MVTDLIKGKPRKEYMKEYRQRPYVKQKSKKYNKLYRQRYNKLYRQRPEYKQYLRKYNQRPKVKKRKNEAQKIRYHTDEKYRTKVKYKAKKNKCWEHHRERKEHEAGLRLIEKAKGFFKDEKTAKLFVIDGEQLDKEMKKRNLVYNHKEEKQ